MRIPELPEASHAVLESIKTATDAELLRQFQEYPEQGKFFAAIFYRYYPIVYSLIAQGIVTVESRDYLLAMIWRQFFYEMRGLDLEDNQTSPLESLQDWIIYNTGILINTIKTPSLITYSLTETPPPLWCYVEQSLENLPPLSRFILVMSEKFGWNQRRIIAYLQTEGNLLSTEQITEYINQAYEQLENSLPSDIRSIYLEG